MDPAVQDLQAGRYQLFTLMNESKPSTVLCRICGAGSLAPILDFGNTPLANRLLKRDQLDDVEPTYPLDLVLCRRCTLLQITETVPPETLFRDYCYFSSTSQSMLDHCRASADHLVGQLELGGGSLVVEAASNDGYMLRNFVARGIPVLGIEPALNIAVVAKREGVDTLAAFFGEALAVGLAAAGLRADLFLANNVLAHVADTNGFVEGIRVILAPRGRCVIEVPYAMDLVEGGKFDTIYHEHLCYFSLTSLDHLFARHGLEIVDVERLAIHGGSLRFTAVHRGVAPRSEAVAELLANEVGWGVDRPEFYEGLTSRIALLKTTLLEKLATIKAAGQRIVAYGASAKGSTLLNLFGIGRETLDFIVDRSERKQGLFTPGTHLPILPAEALLAEMPDYVLLLTWNFAAEILEQQAEYRKRGGRFLIPIPELRVI